MQANSEGIYGTRPWKIYGEGPSTKVVIPKNGKEFDPNEGKKPDLTAADVRFTSKGSVLYAFVQGWPRQQRIVIQALGTRSPHAVKIAHVSILGQGETLNMSQQSEGLHIFLPADKPAASEIGFALKLSMA